MRIFDYSSEKPLDDICIYLTPNEARELITALKELVEGKIDQHFHVADEKHKHEIAVAIYTQENLSTFDERSQKLIREDK